MSKILGKLNYKLKIKSWIEFLLIKNRGIESETEYPYIAKQGKCLFNRKKVAVKCNGFVDILAGDEEALKQAIAIIGPVSVAIGIYFLNINIT